MTETTQTSNAKIAAQAAGPKYLDQFLDAARQHGRPKAWAEQSAEWCRRFIVFHGKCHPCEMGIPDVGRFLEHVAATGTTEVMVVVDWRPGRVARRGLLLPVVATCGQMAFKPTLE